MVLCLVVVFLFSLILLIKDQYLLITDSDSGKILFCEKAADEETFSIAFVHSVNKSLVEDVYLIRDGSIMLSSSFFTAFGAGMPTAAGADQTFCTDDGMMHISGYDWPLEDLRYSVGRNANHTLKLRDQTIPLNTLAEPGTSVSFSLREYPSLFSLLHLRPHRI